MLFGVVDDSTWNNNSREIDKQRIPKVPSIRLKCLDFSMEDVGYSYIFMFIEYKPLVLS
jgi:hypothetical protein